MRAGDRHQPHEERRCRPGTRAPGRGRSAGRTSRRARPCPRRRRTSRSCSRRRARGSRCTVAAARARVDRTALADRKPRRTAAPGRRRQAPRGTVRRPWAQAARSSRPLGFRVHCAAHVASTSRSSASSMLPPESTTATVRPRAAMRAGEYGRERHGAAGFDDQLERAAAKAMASRTSSSRDGEPAREQPAVDREGQFAGRRCQQRVADRARARRVRLSRVPAPASGGDRRALRARRSRRVSPARGRAPRAPCRRPGRRRCVQTTTSSSCAPSSAACSAISRPTVPCPAMMSGSSKEGTRTAPRSVGEPRGDLLAALAQAVVGDDFGAERERVPHLHARCVGWHHDRGRYAQQLRGRRDPLGVVA